jgi:hypothetical protein
MSGLASRCVDAAPGGWEALVRDDPGAGPSHRTELARAIAATVPGMRTLFVAVERDGALVGGCPVLVERRGPLQWVHVLPWGLSGAPLAVPGMHAEVDTMCATTLAGLKRDARAVGGGWVALRGAGPDVADGTLERIGGVTRLLECSRIDLAPGGIEAAWSRVDRKTRQDLRHARASGLVFAEEPAAVGAAHALHVRQGRGWRGHRAPPLELARRLLASGGGAPAARLFTMRDRDGVVAALLALDHPREILPWWSGLHPGARHRHASALLLWSVVEWSAANGRAGVNLGGSAGLDPLRAFKASLGARSVRYPVRWFDAADAPWTGRLASGLLRLRRRAVGREPA